MGPAAAAELFGRGAQWLRSLERRGIIPPPLRRANGYRVYDPTYLAQIRPLVEEELRRNPPRFLTGPTQKGTA